jgi:ketosteroid isomerase-like protein
MTLDDLQAAVRSYEAAWNETDADKRMSALEAAWADDAVYIDDDVPDRLRGRDALSKYIAEEHESEPGLVITTTRELVILGDRGWLQWTAHSATGSQSSGTDFIEFAADSRIARLTDFLD